MTFQSWWAAIGSDNAYSRKQSPFRATSLHIAGLGLNEPYAFQIPRNFSPMPPEHARAFVLFVLPQRLAKCSRKKLSVFGRDKRVRDAYTCLSPLLHCECAKNRCGTIRCNFVPSRASLRGLGWGCCSPILAVGLICDINVSMRRQSLIPQKKRGPPATGKGEPLMVRLQPSPLAALDAWIARQDDEPSRPEAIRRLVEQALAGTPPMRQRSPRAASKARDLASNQIDKLFAASTTDEERQQRKRRLLKGPKEFRDVRGDTRSKSKS